MRLDGPVGIGIAWNGLRSLVLLGCTALMRANSPKHPSGCLQFAQMGERMDKGGRWDVCKEGEERTGEGSPCAFVFVYSLIIDESEGVVCMGCMNA